MIHPAMKPVQHDVIKWAASQPSFTAAQTVGIAIGVFVIVILFTSFMIYCYRHMISTGYSLNDLESFQYQWHRHQNSFAQSIMTRRIGPMEAQPPRLSTSLVHNARQLPRMHSETRSDVHWIQSPDGEQPLSSVTPKSGTPLRRADFSPSHSANSPNNSIGHVYQANRSMRPSLTVATPAELASSQDPGNSPLPTYDDIMPLRRAFSFDRCEMQYRPDQRLSLKGAGSSSA